MIVLIPAYEPGNRMLQLIQSLTLSGSCDIVVVDDGSGPAYHHFFEDARALGCTILTHPINLGKGVALKTGFSHIRSVYDNNSVIVTADCDGQHLPVDIYRIAEAMDPNNREIILGTRRFTGKVPLKSRLGNNLTRGIFSFVSGVKIYDTQTGLRAIPANLLNWLCELPGGRFEYEMNMLLEAAAEGIPLKELDIETVYLEENKSSHFRPLKDSASVYLPIFKFSLSSLLSGVLDFVLLGIIQLATSNLLLAVIGARLCSSLFNYTVNRLFVFSRSDHAAGSRSMPRYFLLVGVVMLLNYGVIDIYYSIIGLSLFLAKLFTEVTIFFFSYWSQRKFVFTK